MSNLMLELFKYIKVNYFKYNDIAQFIIIDKGFLFNA